MMQQLPLFEPKSDWVTPSELPNVPSGLDIAVDTETRDDGLARESAPSWVTREGWIAGVSVAWADREVYLPLRHPDSQNMDAEQVMPWLQDVMYRSRRVYMHNRQYDEGWLSTEGVTVREDTDDTQAMAVMVDENRDRYNLDACCRWRGVQGKDEAGLREAASIYGLDPKSDLWKLPARYVGPYAEQDARATLDLARSLQPELEVQGLVDAYHLERDLMSMTLAMRRRGIRIDEDRAVQVQSDLRRQRDELIEDMRKQLGWRALSLSDLNSPASLERMHDQEGVSYPRTPKTNRGSFKTDWMKEHVHWVPRAVARARELEAFASKFIGNYILDSTHLGRVHAEIHQLRDDEGGTCSFRLSYSDPPLQQIPARSAMAPLIRSMFLPEEDTLWGAADYSQQEPRMAVHFAALCRVPGFEDAVRYYTDDPAADFHTMVAELTGLPRKKAKIINLGVMYGMGLYKLATSLGVTEDEAESMLEQYHSRMPFVDGLNKFCGRRARTRGFIKLLDGARSHFDDWELAWGESGVSFAACDHARALKLADGRRIRRAHTRKAMNRLIQGSSARQTKMAMRECWREGLLPLLQLHDELDVPVASEAEGRRVAEIMENVIELKVPMRVDLQYGQNWGQASEEMEKGVVPPSFSEVLSSKSNADILAMRR